MKKLVLFIAIIVSVCSVAKMTPSDVSLTMFRSVRMVEPTVFSVKVAISDWDSIGDAYQMRKYRDQYYAIGVIPIERDRNQRFTSFTCFAKKDGKVGEIIFDSLKDGKWHAAYVKLRHSKQQNFENICLLEEIEIVGSYKTEETDNSKENEIEAKFGTTRLSIIHGRDIDYLAGRISLRIKTKLKYIKKPVLRVVVLTEEAGILEVNDAILPSKDVKGISESFSRRDWREGAEIAKEISLEQTEVASSSYANAIYSGLRLGKSFRTSIRGGKLYDLIGYLKLSRDKKCNLVGYRIELWHKGRCVEFYDTIKQATIKKYELPDDWYVSNKYASKYKYTTLVGYND